MLPAQPNQSLMHGIQCLQAISIADGPLGSREVARRLDLEHTKVNRLLGTLAALGFVTRTADRRYVPGPALHVLSAQSLSASGLLQASIPVLRRGRIPDMIVALGVVWRDEVCYLVHAAPGVDPGDAIGAHGAYPAAESVIGRCLQSVAGLRSGAPGPAEVSFRKPDGEFSVAAAVGDPAVAAVAVTGACPADREGEVMERVRAMAREIDRELPALRMSRSPSGLSSDDPGGRTHDR